MMMAQIMRIESAEAWARIIYILFKFKIISEYTFNKMIDDLTVRSLQYQMGETDESGKKL